MVTGFSGEAMKFKLHTAVLVVMLFTAGIFLPSSAWSEPPPANDKQIKTQAVQLLGKRQFVSACNLLEKNYPTGTADIGALFLKARCRIGIRDYATAISLYKQVVQLSPNSPRAREELAKAVDLQAQEKKKSRDWFAEVSTGFVVDSNINSGPQSDQIMIDGTPVILTGASGDNIDAIGYNVSGNAGYIHVIGDTDALIARVAADRTAYFHPGEYEFDTFSTGAGYSRSFNKTTRVLMMSGVSWQAFGGATYKTSADFSTRLTTKIDAKNTVSLALSGSGNSYRESKSLSGLSFTLSPKYTHILNDQLSWNASLTGRIDNARSRINSSDSSGFRTGFDFKPTPTISTDLSYQQTRKRYEAPDLFFGPNRRSDTQHVVSAGISWDISRYTADEVKFNIRQQYINNESNLPIYALSRYITTFSVSKSW